jgi:azurin
MKKNILLLFSTALFIGCGERAGDAPQDRGHELPPPESTIQASQEILFHVRAIGNTMAEIDFEPKEFSVPANARVRVLLVNESQGEGMSHNIVFVTMGAGEQVAQQALQAGPDKNYLPNSPDIMAASEVIAPGESTEFEFTAPSSAGSYHYICTYPGHYPQMIGRLNIVE